MDQTHKKSFIILLGLLFLLPIFFIPGGSFLLDSSKLFLVIFGLVVSLLVFLYELWQQGNVNLPKHYFLLAVALLPLAYLLSAIIATPSSLSLLGYYFETGTFGYVLLGSLALILVSMIFADISRLLQSLVAFFFSLSILALFVVVKIIFGGDVLVFGTLFGNMGNPIGNWTDLAIIFGLLSVFSALTIGMIPMKLGARLLLYSIFVFSTGLLVIVNFSLAFILTLIFAILLLAYFSKIEKNFHLTEPSSTTQDGNQNKNKMFSFLSHPTFLPIMLGLISLISIINPSVSKTEKLNSVISQTFNVENIDVRPSLSATLSVSKAVLSEGAFLGSGPNTFGHDWLIYKPVDINTTPFWSTVFPFGVGFLPTQIASTGILGTTLWLSFFVLLILLGIKAFRHTLESNRSERFALVAVSLIGLFLWMACFFYVPSAAIPLLAFIFSGLFVAVLVKTGVISSLTFSIRDATNIRLTSMAIFILVILGSLSFGWFGFEKMVSIYYYKKAVDLSNNANVPLENIESYLVKAVESSPADIYHVALARVYFAKAQVAANATTGTSEENRAVFEEALRKSIQAARDAVDSNPKGYQNWIILGSVYSSLVPEPLAAEGAYENAQFAYNEASKRNPANPELPLLLARLELNKGDKDKARSYIRNSIALKEDYADAYLALVELEIGAGNTEAAITSAEKLASLAPNNPGIPFEIGLLKYSSGDYDGAIEAFNSALTITPDYANAQYYLGLTLSKLKRYDEALEQFRALAVTNPDNEEVKRIITSLEADKNPF